MSAFETLSCDALHWFPEHGVGYFPVADGLGVYDAAYFERYRRMDQTEVGAALTAMRLRFVREHYIGSDLLDVGIGGGAFVLASGAQGYDVNAQAVAWLQAQGVWRDLYTGPLCEAVSFWDSLEHMQDPDTAIARVGRWAFVSVPVFDGPDHVLHSKHYRQDEHYWYWTARGLARYMSERGFVLRTRSLMEQAVGREGIGTFAFERAT